MEAGAAVPGSAGPCLQHPSAGHQHARQSGSGAGHVHRHPGHLPPPPAPGCLLTVPAASHLLPGRDVPVHRERWLSGEGTRRISDSHCHQGMRTGMIPVLQMTKQSLGSGLLAPGLTGSTDKAGVKSGHCFYSEYPSSAVPSPRCCLQFLTTIWDGLEPP